MGAAVWPSSLFTLPARRMRECDLLSEVVNMDDGLLFLIENSQVRREMTKIRIGVQEMNKERERDKFKLVDLSRSRESNARSATKFDVNTHKKHIRFIILRERRMRQPPARPLLSTLPAFIREHLRIIECV
ncbi:hypothetical protein EVAR_35592_1 [Eumeta japonica]|uniref:Uncharacterized protein n=1 Tax=Eumeta variegata TaxID=151549 RepID=A0A4C1XM38_EUMVA|nr:hypothetical protein EVAR_35592_1 [Eumeta japonica]